MRIVFLWPGPTRNKQLRVLQEEWLERLKPFGEIKIIETAEAKGLKEKWAEKILEKEAQGLEKHLEGSYIICLSDKGKEMSSEELARLIEQQALNSGKRLLFLVGGFLGLSPRIMEKAHLKLSLSRLTFSHELTRVVLLEQIYRALNLIKGYSYPK
ncbi:MAG: 23S rRNA (pseudouridine(1915)-N(3))-methyltransferase RlmH [Candidatus Saccharicenans sp.]